MYGRNDHHVVGWAVVLEWMVVEVVVVELLQEVVALQLEVVEVQVYRLKLLGGCANPGCHCGLNHSSKFRSDRYWSWAVRGCFLVARMGCVGFRRWRRCSRW